MQIKCHIFTYQIPFSHISEKGQETIVCPVPPYPREPDGQIMNKFKKCTDQI